MSKDRHQGKSALLYSAKAANLMEEDTQFNQNSEYYNNPEYLRNFLQSKLTGQGAQVGPEPGSDIFELMQKIGKNK